MKNAASRPGHVIAFLIQISNSHTSAFSRRDASEVCQCLARPARECGALGGARAPMGTLGGGINVPTSRGKAPRAPKARRSASQRSTGHQAIDRSGAPRSGQLSLCPLRVASRKRPLIGQDGSRISGVLGTGIAIPQDSKNLMLMNGAFKKPHRHPEALAATRRASKDRLQAQAAILRDAAQEARLLSRQRRSRCAGMTVECVELARGKASCEADLATGSIPKPKR